MIDVILFDWDGTLIDTARQAFEAFVKQFRDLGVSVDPETYERIYSPNWYSMYEELGLPRERWEEADDRWLRHYAGATSGLVPGAQAALRELARRNYALAIVTSGNRARVLYEIDALGLNDTFRIVVCSDDVLNRKPDPEGLELAMRALQKDPEVCCYVGDSPDDIEMGRRAGVLTVGIPGRYPSSRKLREARPDRCFASLGQFLEEISVAGKVLKNP
jgi:HAD superfamily hydrolase (TIGR01509 family)